MKFMQGHNLKLIGINSEEKHFCFKDFENQFLLRLLSKVNYYLSQEKCHNNQFIIKFKNRSGSRKPDLFA